MKGNRYRESSVRKRSKRILVPFRRELGAIQKEYDHVITALNRGDLARVRVTACHLALAWLQMEAAFIRFIERTPEGLGLGPRARQERSVLSESNCIARSLLRRSLTDISNWNSSSDELRVAREILCWLHERLGVCSVVGFPDLSSPHAAPSAGSRGRSRVRKQTGKR